MDDAVLEWDDEDVLAVEFSDEALEAAASVRESAPAISFPSAPTVSILVVCCSID
jgi:hypothetical protein